VLTVQLEIAKGEWHPEADDGMALSVYAFGAQKAFCSHFCHTQEPSLFAEASNEANQFIQFPDVRVDSPAEALVVATSPTKSRFSQRLITKGYRDASDCQSVR
jgi:hypothetical protein